MEAYEFLKVIYRTASVEISKCVNRSTQEVCAVKALKVDDYKDSEYHVKEIINLSSLKPSTHYADIVEFFFEGDGLEIHKICIVSKFYENGDLSKELERRERMRDPYTEQELNNMIGFLLSGFKKLQEKGISHRDIKPENIFIDADKGLKIGDLGSCNEMMKTEQTIVGSFYYMSPEVRKSFHEFQMGNSGPRVGYDPIKSDVWSLGLTFLYMITLKSVKEFAQPHLIEENVKNRLSRVSENYKELLKNMLVIDPQGRKDFIQLEEMFSALTANKVTNELEIKSEMISDQNASNSLTVSTVVNDARIQCNGCGQHGATVNCMNCGSLFHPYCFLHMTNCRRCGTSIDFSRYVMTCFKCNRAFNVKEVKFCNHLMCVNCQETSKSCKYCFHFDIAMPKTYQNYVEASIKCSICGNFMRLDQYFYYCVEDSYRICRICKRVEHLNSCLMNDQGTSAVCYCCGNTAKKKIRTFLYDCAKCNETRCLVCSRKLRESSHLLCATLYSARFRG